MDTSRKVLILGATTNQDRYAYKAAEKLIDNNFNIIPVGIKKGSIFENTIKNDKTIVDNIHTITLYIGPDNQKEWYNYIIDTKPKRVIFNPGTENSELQTLLVDNRINYEEACTLVLLNLKALSLIHI